MKAKIDYFDESPFAFQGILNQLRFTTLGEYTK